MKRKQTTSQKKRKVDQWEQKFEEDLKEIQAKMFEYSKERFHQLPPNEPLYKAVLQQETIEHKEVNIEKIAETVAKKTLEKMVLLLLKFAKDEIDVRFVGENITPPDLNNEKNAENDKMGKHETIKQKQQKEVIESEGNDNEKSSESSQPLDSSRKETNESEEENKSNEIKINDDSKQDEGIIENEKSKSFGHIKTSSKQQSENDSVDVIQKESNIYCPNPSTKPLPKQICDVSTMSFSHYDRPKRKSISYQMFVPHCDFKVYIKKQIKHPNPIVAFVSNKVDHFKYDNRYGFYIPVKSFQQLVLDENSFNVKKSQVANYFHCILEKVKVTTETMKTICFIIDPSKFYQLSINN
ncbi:hypothetical protein QTN25_004646 [Entamoeba marina]